MIVYNVILSLKNLIKYGGSAMDRLSTWGEVSASSQMVFDGTEGKGTMLDKEKTIITIGNLVWLPSPINGRGTVTSSYSNGNKCFVKRSDGKKFNGSCDELVVISGDNGFMLKPADFDYGRKDPLDIKTEYKNFKIGDDVLLPYPIPSSTYRWGKLYGTRNDGKLCIVRTQDGNLFWGPCRLLQS